MTTLYCDRCNRFNPPCGFYEGRRICKECRRKQVSVTQKGRKRPRYRSGDNEYPVFSHAKYLLERYGLTPEEYFALKESRHGICDICGDAPSKSLVLDHDHSTNAFRGFICHACNLALGHVKDNASILYSMIDYLGSN